MSAQSLPFTESSKPVKPMAVSFRFLLALYLFIPVCLVVQLVDQYFLNYSIRDALPSSPGHFLLFQLLFGTPHIIASSLLLLAHPDYLRVFRKRLVLMTVFIATFFGIGSLFIPYTALYIITACWTVYHVLKQQHGIAKAVCRLPQYAFNLQVGLSVIGGCFIYLGVFLKNSLSVEQAEQILILSMYLSIALILCSVWCLRFIKTAQGFWFLWANTLLVVISYYFLSQQYYFLAILIPRLVHDISAYSFYVSHDHNRHQFVSDRHPIYALVRSMKIPVVVVLPIFSFMLTYLLQAYGDEWINIIMRTLFATEIYKAITLGLFGYLALMHYYSEAFIWSAASPLRQYIVFKR